MKNDTVLKLMLEDSPGLLRNEFTSARLRAGLTKKSMGDIDLMFKQGGILKGQYGLNPKNYNLGAVFNKNFEKSVTP
jgi:hypothetical protein